MQIIAQGLRRSGTTILYDIFEEDSRFVTFYEPLSRAKVSIGGGSKIKRKDYMLNLRKEREAFSLKHQLKHKEIYNFGAPTNYKLESSYEKMPSLLDDYIKHLLNIAPNTFLKFTRATFQIEKLNKLSNDNAIFIHIYKNPIRFVESHLCYNNWYRSNSDLFFSVKEGFNNWSQESIVNYFIKNNQQEFKSKSAVFKLLYLWKEFNNIIERDGRSFFKDRYIKLSNENLINKTEECLSKIYDLENMEPLLGQLNWANKNLVKSKKLIYQDDKRWEKYFDELKIPFEFLEF